ncbi:hypothetical protein Ga0123461_0548 [Mariprofundus aestuarium]|uniref:Uncharacterized protein n=1 Tax=Mariprofundus aestuarium TaxID=1921086 RepID=A0A2K8KW21_MARES|nr:hypothetical protein Ga0123461_0548 [Mariprofundus aestuarium]
MELAWFVVCFIVVLVFKLIFLKARRALGVPA